MPEPDPKDRRESERFPVNPDAACTFAAPVVEDLGAARLRDVSMQGIGLLTARRVQPGTLLAVSLANPAKGFARTVLVRVVHVTPQSGGWLVGGTFETPLAYQEMTALVL
jgi:hypothetical protein